MELAVIGDDAFNLGFRLAGIRNARTYRSESDLLTVMRDERVGIAIMSQQAFDRLSESRKEDVLTSIKPVVVVLSEQPQEGLRRMIIRSIGVDLLREEHEQ